MNERLGQNADRSYAGETTDSVTSPAMISRREIFIAAGSAAGVLAMGGCAGRPPMVTHDDGRAGPVKVPGEELMSQHGVLNRTLVVYDTLLRRQRETSEIDSDALHGAAAIIDEFVEKHHERLEGHYVFPRFKMHPTMGPFVLTLGLQHHAGRRITAALLGLSRGGRVLRLEETQRAAELLERFVFMYRAHESREDTILFPEFRKLLTPQEYAALGEDFEREERERLGSDGYEQYVDRVAMLEKKLGIENLGSFTRDVW